MKYLLELEKNALVLALTLAAWLAICFVDESTYRCRAQDGILATGETLNDVLAESIARRLGVKSHDYSYRLRYYHPVRPSDREPVRLADGNVYRSETPDQFWDDEDKRVTEIIGRVISSEKGKLQLHIALLKHKGEEFRQTEFPLVAGFSFSDEKKFLTVDPLIALDRGKAIYPLSLAAVIDGEAFQSEMMSLVVSRASLKSVKIKSLGPIDYRGLGLHFPGNFARKSTLEALATAFKSWSESGGRGTWDGAIVRFKSPFQIEFDRERGLWPVVHVHHKAKVQDGKVILSEAFRSELDLEEVKGRFVPSVYTVKTPGLSYRIDYSWHSLDDDVTEEGRELFSSVQRLKR